MPTTAADARTRLRDIYADAHEQTLHPNLLGWPGPPDAAELDFISRVVYDQPGRSLGGCAYLVKELAQLAEIERHLSAVFGIITAQLGADDSALSEGYDLHHALNLFAAEEYIHSDFFYRYVRELAGADIKLADSLFMERLALYEGDDSPYVKLAAMCMAAYVGESVITVFEKRTAHLDPRRERFLTRLLWAHGMDEARHVQVDHVVINHVIPSLTAAERDRAFEIFCATEELNAELGGRFQQLVRDQFGLDHTPGNRAWEVQQELGQVFRRALAESWPPVPVDERLDDTTRALLLDFAGDERVHA
ncbi:hypothetical protein CW362_40375 [Streptomyces populi]|uniref:Uncharacterized protein n=1 Tax=Streptomyces populi TaxID=2058924 RepID=A0A2I0SC14_9ACTN|nr:hypothetical protein [Streptomyces populi]PKT67460.1 hypothetical protein CW362_40375 [Streptomyces populi]